MPMFIQSRRSAIWILFLTAILWSSSGLFVKVITWSPLAILSGRSILATVVFLCYLGRPRLQWSRWQLVGAFAYIGTQLFFVAGTKLTTAANVIFLSFTSPIYIVLFGYWFLRERAQRADWMTMPVIFIGMMLFFGDDFGFDSILGNLYGVLAGVSMAVMILCLRRQKDGTPANTILLGNLISTLLGLPWLLQESFSATNLSIIVFLGIFQMGLSFVLYSTAIKHVHALESTLILTLEPVLNPVWVFLVLGEIPGPRAVLGGALVLGAVTVRAILGMNATEEDRSEVEHMAEA